MRAHLDRWESRSLWTKLLWSRAGSRWMRRPRARAVRFTTPVCMKPAGMVAKFRKSTMGNERNITNRARIGTNQPRAGPNQRREPAVSELQAGHTGGWKPDRFARADPEDPHTPR